MDEGTHIHVLSLSGAGEGRLAGLFRQLRSMALRIFSDEVLMSRARAGDPTAFDALVARHRGHLDALALDTLRRDVAMGGTLRETVLAAFENLDSCGARCTADTWLYLHGLRAVFRRMPVPPGGTTSNPVQ